MYKLSALNATNEQTSVIRLSDSSCVPFSPANTDYAEFKKAVTAGAELQDADGNVMTAEAAKEFVKGLA